MHTGTGCLESWDRQHQTWKKAPTARRRSLLRIKEHLAEELGKQRDDPVVCEEETVLLQQLPPRLKRLELAAELLHADDARDELDARGLKKVLVLSLRILDEQANGSRPRVDERVGQGAAKGRRRNGRASAQLLAVKSSDAVA